jgi:hydrogenase expression/formation protein HypD
MLVAQLEDGRAVVDNQYARSVTYRGNTAAQQILRLVFEVCDRKWRGIGTIPQSGLRLRPVFASHDAEQAFGLEEISAPEPPECISAQVLQGLKRPTECPAFAGRCTPRNPLGAPMVSTEGACAAYYQYRRQVAPVGRQGNE